MKVLERQYQQLVDDGEVLDDAVQRQLIDALQDCYDQLLQQDSWWRRCWGRTTTYRGLYLWGGVGVGKTFVMDLFYHALPFEEKMRMHFHAFMQSVQQALQARQGQADPLVEVAADIAKRARVLCFDEFFVSDIGDAMILERLFQALFSAGTMLITTSNIPPEKLYWDGLQRKRFLPAIALIQSHCQVMSVESQQDYRYRQLEEKGTYLVPADAASDATMETLFTRFAMGDVKNDITITIQNRPIIAKQVADNIVWFAFDNLCCVPRSQVDYLEIANYYPWVFVSGLPRIDEFETAKVTYLIYLIDVFYDRRVRLVLSAADKSDNLYTSGIMLPAFQRTVSRIHEMSTKEYFADAAKARS